MNTVNIKNISTHSALKIASSVMDLAKEHKVNLSTTILDKSGNIVAQVRDNNAVIITADISFKKAFTALNMNCSTADALSLSKENSEFSDLASIKNFLLLRGGVPIVVDGETIGSVGVSGADPMVDEKIALESIKKVIG